MAQRYLLHQLLQEDQEPFLLTKYISDRRSQIKRPFPNNTLQVKKRKSTNPSANFPGNLCKSVCLFSLTDTPDFRKSPLFEFASAAKSPCKSPNAIFLHIPSRTASMLLEAAVRIQKHSSPASRPKTKAQSFGLLGSLYKRLTQRSQKKREIEGGGSVKVSVKDILRWDSSVGRKKSSNKKEDEETVNVNASVCEVGFACSYNGRTSSALWSETNEDKSLDLETSSSGYSEEIHFLTNHKNSTCFCESPFRFVLQTNSPSSGHHTPEFPSPSRHATEEKESNEGERVKKFESGEEEEEDKEQCSGDFAPGPNNGLGPSNTRKRRDSEDDSAKAVSTSNAVNEGDGKRVKATGNGDGKGEGEVSSGKPAEQSAKPPSEAPKQDYIHVRARRGQATDSHSLAERARREKISERMKILQDLVPGCNKVIGKALVLDEIINYIQSLQRQVEFLSMKLEAVNSRLNSGIEAFPPKDFGQHAFDPAGIPFGSQAPREYSRGSSPEWLHMQVGGGFERTT